MLIILGLNGYQFGKHRKPQIVFNCISSWKLENLDNKNMLIKRKPDCENVLLTKK